MSDPRPAVPTHRFAAASTGIVAIGACVGIFGTGLFRFASPSELFAFSLLLGTIALVALAAQISGSQKSLIATVGLAAAAFTTAGFHWFKPAVLSSEANDRRCLAIQRDMLSAHPRRVDGPDLFQALGCRPQGEGSVYAPPSNPHGRLARANELLEG